MDINNQFYIFKEFLEANNNIDYEYVTRLRKLEGLSNNDVKKIKEFSKIVKGMRRDAKNNLERYSDLLFDYKIILEKTIMLAKELNLTNSLEYSILYTYLIHKGYFSKYKIINYKLEGRKNIFGLYQLDIMAGRAVCLNFSEMLKDLLNTAGFNSATIASSNTYKNPLLEKLLIRDSHATHAANLILEHGKMYIYDSINEFIFKIESKNNAKIISGADYYKYKYIYLYKYKLYPYQSYYINFNQKETGVLDILHRRNDFDSPYNKENYKETRENCIEIFKQNRQLISDYRDCTSENICTIANRLKLIPNQ